MDRNAAIFATSKDFTAGRKSKLWAVARRTSTRAMAKTLSGGHREP